MRLSQISDSGAVAEAVASPQAVTTFWMCLEDGVPPQRQWAGGLPGAPATAQGEEMKHEPSRCPAAWPTPGSERARPRRNAKSPQTSQCCSGDPRWPWEGGEERTHNCWLSKMRTCAVCCSTMRSTAALDTHHSGGLCLSVFSTGKMSWKGNFSFR